MFNEAGARLIDRQRGKTEREKREQERGENKFTPSQI